jgi:hypothetical protein
MPECEGVIVIIHDPCGDTRVSEKNKMLQSFTCCHLPMYLSLYHCLVSCHDIIERSCDETWYNYRSIYSFIEIEAIVGNGGGDGAGRGVHEVRL